ncbi:MAG: DUF1805 domain-containing protein [Candidatus Kaelpia aquatica]|nr:DUF1805 domain-containing protein [Candidatus Kaelpia aquatica]
MIKEIIKVGDSFIEAVSIKLGNHNLIILRGSRGYIMCGYLNMDVADNFGDIAIKITGVGTIQEALDTAAKEVSREAKNIGIYEGQSINEILKLIV